MSDTRVVGQKLLAVGALAKTLSTSVRTVWRKRAAGQLPKPVRIGGSVRWRSSDIDRWIEWGCPNQAEFKMRNEVRHE